MVDEYLSEDVRLGVSKPMAARQVFLPAGPLDIVSVANLWQEGVRTMGEYSELLTPRAVYLTVNCSNKGPQ